MKTGNTGEFPELVSVNRLDYIISKWIHEWSHDLTESIAHLFQKYLSLAKGGGNFNFSTVQRNESSESGVTFDQADRTNNQALHFQASTVQLLNPLILGLLLNWRLSNTLDSAPCI